jgi:outer membrane protein assembly factor BamE (lipoprotein component of BamABCDE complex)
MFFINKFHFFLRVFVVSLFLLGCQLKEPTKNHGILFLKNRSDTLIVNKSNKNDILKKIGFPHSKSISNKNEWIYIERVLTKGDYLKFGQNILKTNNILILNFNKYGVLSEKKFLDKNSKEKIIFSEKITENKMSHKSFVQKILQSLKSKMYKNK